MNALLSSYEKSRRVFLIATSYVFYGYWDMRFLFLLFEVSIVSYGLGLWLEKDLTKTKKKMILVLGIVFNLSVLLFFKYFGFFLHNVSSLLTSLGLAREIPLWEVLLPMGISFFTFQSMSYIIDVYRGEIKANRSLLDLLLYISFFPQLVAGPIVRAKDFLPQLKKPRPMTHAGVSRALTLIALGLFKKVILAHYIYLFLVEPAFSDPDRYGGLDLLLGAYGYAIQIYCDFSAYSDMAIGFAYLLGFEFQKNFDRPYLAKSLTEFWHRWHISLSQWLRDYLYIPLGGNRAGRLFTYRNVMITMLLGGLWHGAQWTFVIWGGLHGLWLCAERGLRSLHKEPILSPIQQWFLTFHFVCLCWVFFHSDSLETALDYLMGLTRLKEPSVLVTPLNVSLLTLGFLGHVLPRRRLVRVVRWWRARALPLQGSMASLALVIISALGPGTMAPFIYFRF